MLNTFLTRIKSKCSKAREKLNSESSGLKNSRCETQNSLTKTSRPFLKNSVISSSRSTNHKSEYTSPNKMSELSYEKKLENIRLWPVNSVYYKFICNNLRYAPNPKSELKIAAIPCRVPIPYPPTKMVIVLRIWRRQVREGQFLRAERCKKLLN